MKLPHLSPTLEAILGNQAVSLENLLRKSASLPQERSSYWHWDELLSQQPPEGFSTEEWWGILKLSRNLQQNRLALIGTDQKPVVFTQPDFVLEILYRLDQKLGTEEALFTETSLASREERKIHALHTLFEEAIASAQLEGTSGNAAEAKTMLATGRPPKDQYEQTAANNYAAFLFLKQHINDPLTPATLLEAHRLLMEKLLPEHADSAGRFRREEENVQLESFDGQVLFAPPPAAELPHRVQLFCDFLNNGQAGGFIHPLVRAILAHFWLAYDHPFVDGNGRLARMLFSWSLLRQGYPLIEHISLSETIFKHAAAYFHAFLQTETDENDATYFIINQLDMLTKALDAFAVTAREKQIQSEEIFSQLYHFTWINHRQEQILLHALKHPGAIYTIESQQGFHQVSFATARSDLLELVKAGLLLLRKTRPHRFIAPADLPERLKKTASARSS